MLQLALLRHGFDHVQQALRRDRLRQVGPRTRPEGDAHGVVAGIRAEHHDRRHAARAPGNLDATKHIPAGTAGHMQVHEDQVDAFVGQARQGFIATGTEHGQVTGALQDAPHDLAIGGIVVYHQAAQRSDPSPVVVEQVHQRRVGHAACPGGRARQGEAPAEDRATHGVVADVEAALHLLGDVTHDVESQS